MNSPSPSPPQPPAAAAAAARILAAADDWTLAALDSVTGSCKSFVLALALCRRRLSAREVRIAARVPDVGRYGEVLCGEMWGDTGRYYVGRCGEI